MITRTIRHTPGFLLRLILFALLGSYVYIAHEFYTPEIHLPGTTLPNPYYDFIALFPLWVYLVLCFTLLSILFVFVFIVLSSYYSHLRNRDSQLKSKYDKLFAELLSLYFLAGYHKTPEQREEFYKKLKPNLRTRLQLVSFIDTYLKVQELLAVNLADNFKLLIQELELKQRMETFLYSNVFDDKILALKIISYLRITTYQKQIHKYAESNNVALRTEAYGALIRLMESGEDLTNFIGEKHALSMLDTNIIVNAVLKNNKLDIDYRSLLSSKQIRKNMVGLLLAQSRFRKNINNLILIINHIESNDPILRQLAWDALLKLIPDDDAIDMIVQEFEKQPDEVKLSIIKNSKVIATKRFIEFLKKSIQSQTLVVKIEIMKILFERDFSSLLNFEGSDDPEIKMAYNEVSNIFLSM